ncbi:MAG TPA: hypothetical protein VFW44_14840, partial [Bryobacteraceae bacterium]|nr:hypothetical protein [Bryobacteraceae bacterium]
MRLENQCAKGSIWPNERASLLRVEPKQESNRTARSLAADRKGAAYELNQKSGGKLQEEVAIG